MENMVIDELKTKLIMSALRTNNCVRNNDINRNHTNYGSTTAYANVLNTFGINVDVPVYDDNDFLKIPKLIIDGKVINFE